MLSGPEVILLNLLDTQIRVPDYSLIDFQIVQVFEIQLQNVYVVDCNTPPYIQKVDCVLHFYFSLIQINGLNLQRMKETFNHRIIITTTFVTH